MKRRNAECGKIRRPIKRNKITESMHSNTFLYMKFLILWAIVIIADFMLEFRFEFLWPFWLLLRSVHDSFKYKGLAFSVLFVCIAITSDLICLFFIPVHWLFFAASTYVWVQYVWHTDKGICLPTIILWMLFVYLEAAIRWKDSRHMPHLDLCRPFAAHCIGYPVVSLGFGFKSYVGHLMRIRKQREVAKENEFYMQLLQQALPQLPAAEEQTCLPDDHETTAATATTVSTTATAALGKDGASNGIQTLNGDISCGLTNSSSSSSSLVGGLGALTGELIKDLIATTTSLMSGATQHFSERRAQNRANSNSSSSSNSNNNAQTTTNNSTSNNKVLSLGSSSSGNSPSNGHAVSVQNGNATGASHSHKDRSSAGGASALQCSGNNGTVSNGSVRKQSHNGGGSQSTAVVASDREANMSKCDLKGSYHASTAVNGASSGHTNGGAAANVLSAALMLGTAATLSATEKPQAMVNGRDTKDYSTMNGTGGGSSSGKGGGNEYHQQQQQQQQQNQSKENNRLANHSSSNGTGTGHSHTDKSTSCESTNHITSASSSPVSLSSSSSEHNSTQNASSGGKRATVEVDSPVVANGAVAEKTKGKKNRSKQKQDDDRHINLSLICTSCSRLEHEVKRLKGDVSHMKQLENELKQRTDTNANLKSNLQAKNKDAEELEKKVHELTVSKQNDRQMLNSLEQRLSFEQRQRKQLETVLNNERKMRIKAEEKAAKCYSEIASIDEKKKSAELQNRSYEVEMRKMENELRNRDSEERLLSALQAMQEKNMSLEKSLSCETRFKLDLFSALGEARREIELKDGVISKQMEEVADLRAKIAQLVAIMPIMPISPTRPENVGFHHNSASSPVVSSAGSMLRLSNGSPLMVSSSQDMNNNGNERALNMMGQSPQSQMFNLSQQQHHQMAQQQQQQQGSSSSSLDPNARAYTPVNTNSEAV